MAKMEIIKLDEVWLREIEELFRKVILDMRQKGIDQWDEQYPDSSVLRADAVSGSAYGLVEQGKLIGYIAMDEIQASEYASVAWRESDCRALALHRLCVRPTNQRSGFADMLMLRAEEVARERGYGAIRLDSFEGNKPALYVIERNDYAFVGTVRFRKGVFKCYEKRISPPR